MGSQGKALLLLDPIFTINVIGPRTYRCLPGSGSPTNYRCLALMIWGVSNSQPKCINLRFSCSATCQMSVQQPSEHRKKCPYLQTARTDFDDTKTDWIVSRCSTSWLPSTLPISGKAFFVKNIVKQLTHTKAVVYTPLPPTLSNVCSVHRPSAAPGQPGCDYNYRKFSKTVGSWHMPNVLATPTAAASIIIYMCVKQQFNE